MQDIETTNFEITPRYKRPKNATVNVRITRRTHEAIKFYCRKYDLRIEDVVDSMVRQGLVKELSNR